jgi:hypothetical protein
LGKETWSRHGCKLEKGKSHDKRYRGDPKALKDKSKVSMDGINHHSSVEFQGKASVLQITHPSQIVRIIEGK